jgi:PST family polysaccharide transporter
MDRMVINAIAWMGIVKWAGQLIAWVSTFVVVRILTPADYGIVGAAGLYLGLLTVVSEFGIGSAIVTLRTLNPSQLRQINTVSVLFGFAGLLISGLLATSIASFFHAPAVAAVVVVLSTTFLIASLRTVPWALLQRDMRFKRIAAFEGLQQVALAVLSITLAATGFRYWTLVIASIVSAIIPTTFALIFHWVGFEKPRWHELRRALGFSKDVIVQRTAWYAYSSSDFLVAGRVLGESALGAYTVAWTIAHAPIDKIGNVILQVTPSVLSAVQDDTAATRRYVLAITEALAVTIFPLFVGLALVAPDLVPIVFGAKWQSMVVALQLLSLYACFRAILPLLSQVLTTRGEERFTANNMLLAAVLLPIAFIIASHWGITGIALAWICVHPLIAFRLCDRALKSMDISFRKFAYQGLWTATSGCIVMALVVFYVRVAAPSMSNPKVRLTCEILSGGVAYVGTLWLLHRSRIDELKMLVAALRQRPA